MTNKNNAIWYDWNSSSGFEQMEIENQLKNAPIESKKTAQIIKLRHLKKAACKCHCNTKLVVNG